MKLCHNCIHPVCDFCKHFRLHQHKQQDYVGDGWCVLHQRETNVEDECDHFHCPDADESET